MTRPRKTGRWASRDRLDIIDHWLSDVVTLMSDELNYRQRDRLRRMIIGYLIYGERRHVSDLPTQRCFEFIVTTYIEPDEQFN